jgi:hypothetical protein
MMELSPIRIRGEDATMQIDATPTKANDILLSSTIGNEENAENGTELTHERLLKRAKTTDSSPGTTPPKVRRSSFENREEMEIYNSDYASVNISHQPAEMGSNCGTEASSVPDPFVDFSNKIQQEKKATRPSILRVPQYNKTPRPIRQQMLSATPIATSSTSASSNAAASSLVQRMMDKKKTPEPMKHFTPMRIKPKFKKEDVQATDDRHASVAKLSAWLAADPTSHKKLIHTRKGRNVIAKSRQFEKDLVDDIVQELKITRGAVTHKKNWLQGAFQGEKEEEENEFTSLRRTALVSGYAKSEVGGYRAQPVRSFNFARRDQGPRELEARSEIIVDDAASSLSVSDKKDWLKNAFNKTIETPTKKSGCPTTGRPTAMPMRANSDIMHCRGSSNDEITARAKDRFRERSARKLLGKQISTPTTTPMKRSQEQQSEERSAEVPQTTFGAGAAEDIKSPSMQPESKVPENSPVELIAARDHHNDRASEDMEERTGPPTTTIERSSFVEPTGPTTTIEGGSFVEPTVPTTTIEGGSFVEPLTDQAEEDKAPVDFRSAREKLIQRSKDNGNELHLVSKVQRSKDKFEKIQNDVRRRSGPMGMFKASWGHANSAAGRPSNAYKKSFVEDIAPKKSFEELP